MFSSEVSLHNPRKIIHEIFHSFDSYGKLSLGVSWRWKYLFELNGKHYEVIEDIKEGFQEEAIKERYSDVLAKYDYIVGDWGYEQLRMRGFYQDRNAKASIDSKISAVDDYILEYCNFGCAYFVLKKVTK